MKNFWGIIKKFLKELDKTTLFLCIAASGMGLICLYSCYLNYYLSLKMLLVQAAAVGIGVVAACIISTLDYNVLAKLWKIHLPATFLLVVLTFFIGYEPDGTDDKAWIDLGITTIQPSELFKISFILTFALHLSVVKENINKPKDFLLLCLHGGAAIGIIALQGDYGSALVFAAIFVFMMFVAGLSGKFILAGITASAIVFPIFWHYGMPDHLKRRIAIAFNPEMDKANAGMQQYSGKVALGAGQLDGRGLFNEDLYYVPKAYNDFIFSYIGQALGFIGAITALLIITFLCVRLLVTAKHSNNLLGTYICVGIFAMFFTQTFINIGMVLCVMPVIGVTLPFFSHGGTSIVTCFCAIGLAMSVRRTSKKESMFD